MKHAEEPTKVSTGMPTNLPTDAPAELPTDTPTELTDVHTSAVDDKASESVSDSPTELANAQADEAHAGLRSMQTLTHMTRADILASYITAPENEVKLKELLVRVTNKLADGQAGERTGLGSVLHKFCASKIFARAGASVTCVTCKQFYNLVDIFIDGDEAMYCHTCWAAYHGEWPSLLSVQEMLNENATEKISDVLMDKQPAKNDEISTAEPFDNEHACTATAPQRPQREAQDCTSR